MKHELNAKPDCFKEAWPRQLEKFSWIDYVSAIPQTMSVITTWKKKQIPNACLHAWTTYAGDSGGYYVILTIMKNYYTSENILRENEFVVNFPGMDIFEKCYQTIENNSYEADGITSVGLEIERSQVVNAPRIKECFINLECRLSWQRPLHDNSLWHVFAGEVVHVAIESDYAQSGNYGRYGPNGFIYNIPPSKDLETGKQDNAMIGRIERLQAT